MSYGIAAAVDGFYRGREEESQLQRRNSADARAEKDQAWQDEQRQRVREQQGREETLRKDLAATPITKSVTVPGQVANDDDGNAMPVASKQVPVPAHQQLRQYAEAFRKAGDLPKYLDTVGKADELQMRDSAHKVTQLEASAAGKSATEIAAMAQDIFNNDPFPHKIKSFKDDGNGGVIAQIEREDGTVTTQAFRNSGEIMNGLKAMYNPKTWEALQLERQKAAIKAQEEANKPQKVSPGQAIVQNGRVIYQAPPPAGNEYIGDDAQGNPVYRKVAPGAGGAVSTGGAGAGKGKNAAPVDPAAAAQETVQEVTKLKTAEMTEDQYLAAKDNAGRIVTLNPQLPPAMAARIAVAVAKDPSKLKPAINTQTGKIDLIYKDGPNGRVAFNRGVADAVDLENLPLEALGVDPEKAKGMTAAEATKVKREALTKMTATMLSEIAPKEGEALRKSAFDPQERHKLETSLKDQAESVIAQKTAGMQPEQATAVRAAVEKARDERLAALGNTLNLVYNYGPKPKAKAEQKTGFVGGIRMAADIAPAPGSYVAQQREKNQQLEQKKASEQQAKDKARQERVPVATAEAKRLLAAGDKKALYAFQGTDDFDLLDKATKLDIHARLNSIK